MKLMENNFNQVMPFTACIFFRKTFDKKKRKKEITCPFARNVVVFKIATARSHGYTDHVTGD